jgi:hemoglobin-like flavoprotein
MAMSDESPMDELMASYHRCRGDEDFVDTFYDCFMSKSPDIAARFADTDFTIQKLMLRESLLEMLSFGQGVAGSRAEIEKLGRRHRELNVVDEMYAMWLDSLCEAIQKHDPEYTPRIEELWRQAIRKGIEVMLSVE